VADAFVDCSDGAQFDDEPGDVRAAGGEESCELRDGVPVACEVVDDGGAERWASAVAD
jgi:hypothetical protein